MMEVLFSNPDFATVCSIIQFYGHHAAINVFPLSHRHLAEMLANDPGNANFIYHFKRLLSRMNINTDAENLKKIFKYRRIIRYLNLNDKEVAEICANSSLSRISVALKLKLLANAMQEVILNSLFAISGRANSRANFYMPMTLELQQLFNQSIGTARLGNDRFTGDTIWYTIDTVLNIHLINENLVAGKYSCTPRNVAELDELIAKYSQRLRVERADRIMKESNKENACEISAQRRSSRLLLVEFVPKPEPKKPKISTQENMEDRSLLARLRSLRSLREQLATMSLPDRILTITQPLTSDNDAEDCVIVDDLQSANNEDQQQASRIGPIHPTAIHFNDAIVWRYHIEDVIAVGWCRVRQMQRSVHTNTAREYMQQVRSVLERDVHLWEGGCTADDFRRFDDIQAYAQQCINEDGITAAPLELLAKRRRRITLCKFIELVTDTKAMIALPTWMRGFVERALDRETCGEVSEGVTDVDNCFVMRATQMYVSLPVKMQKMVKDRFGKKSTEEFNKWFKKYLERVI